MCADRWYVLVIADARRDRIDAAEGDHHEPRRLVGGFAVGLCLEAIGGHGIRGSQLRRGGSVKCPVADSAWLVSAAGGCHSAQLSCSVSHSDGDGTAAYQVSIFSWGVWLGDPTAHR